MKKFENHVQEIKYSVLKELVKAELKDNLINELLVIPKKIIPGPKSDSRCCIYMERAIINERIKHMLYQYDDEVIKVIDIACDECPINRFSVTEACRGCLAHHCVESCPVGAIEIINKRAHINQEKCIECGKCSSACQFNAISDVRRPCISSCKVGAIQIDHKSKKAVIDKEKCINCGECVFKCPFGAITDTSNILSVVRALKNSSRKDGRRVYAVVAPAVAAQFEDVSLEQINFSLKKIGFHSVLEAALGADIAAVAEAKLIEKELRHKSFVTTSCCPAFVSYIEKNYPDLAENISPALSPMVITGKLIKDADKDATVVFIGPCTAKKVETLKNEYNSFIDYAIGFEELRAMLDAYNIDLVNSPEESIDNASFYGRVFARSGGVTNAINRAIDEYGLDVKLKPVVCSGIKECDRALKLARLGKLNGNFIEGMACEGGCINGPLSLNHKPKNKNAVDIHGEKAKEKTIKGAVRVYEFDENTFCRNQG
ncbi:[FeFe] hydrogenase, group B1/B3 [Dethiosulfatibacter aminovorans DSM 17477]|uniref:[FeFe] hydrogenase, group B1/B3 n=1 Tax=Dethiosulfatibacter aminovorans DSM 17477 TaxID=1121476 RepID=A0A1M6I0Z6_9FIRM|nr:monomeric [FeFe] hydrogenase [Dethiosulfatibacter aminovorans]SHJ28166.1 [FeFe] hydrogenase, group B1/B3 [Dethiosulfatibacter aminovorans DSM 17477]